MYQFSTYKLSGSKDVDVGSSCSSLKQSGHFISGYYNIKQEEVRKVVFCDMGSGIYGEVPQSEELDLSTRGTWCGYQDSWSAANAVITYDTLLLNDTNWGLHLMACNNFQSLSKIMSSRSHYVR